VITRISPRDFKVKSGDTTYYIVRAMRKLNPKPRDNNEIATSFWIDVDKIW